ncbi:translocation/assembly module TamB domain-containing protein [Pseudaestuariivita sp.]|uniref:translocation/assembly module TamB domain-containing protein n=1 Tax=Pseudaestuariivita sp. TaxID=2211669 RepID=UPI0040598C03
MRWFALFLILLWPSLALAQTEDQDRGRIQAFLEDTLSEAGRDVRIVGFRGLLSSEASLEQLTIADDAGIWLTLNDVTLNWNRSALFRGSLEVEELSAAELIVPRLPQTGESEELPSPEAQGFSLPDLPVEIDIARLAIERADLGAPILGEAVSLSFAGSAELAGGAGQADLALTRVDGPAGRFEIEGGYDNADGELLLNITLDEAAEGIAARLLNLPGLPPVALSVQGAGPLDAFAADIALSTDGQQRVTGRVAVQESSDPSVTRRLSAQLVGDLSPLLPPERRGFFGPSSEFASNVGFRADGGLDLDQLVLRTDALDLSGTAALSPEFWPEAFDVTAEIAPPEGPRVALPGSDIALADAELELTFDAAEGNEWQGTLRVVDVEGPGFALDTATLAGTGTIDGDGSAPLRSVAGQLNVAATTLTLDDPALTEAVGQAPSGALRFAYTSGAPLELNELELVSDGLQLTGQVQLTGLQDGLDLQIAPGVTVVAPELARFSGLAGRDLAGAATLRVDGRLAPLAGTFNLKANGTTQNLSADIAQLDPLLEGAGTLRVEARRDLNGTFIDAASVATPHASIRASGRLQTEGTALDADVTVSDIGRALDGVTGPVRFVGSAAQSGELWDVAGDLTAPGGVVADVDSTLTVTEAGLETVSAEIAARVADLSPYAAVAGRPLSGSAQLTLSGEGVVPAQSFAGTLDVAGRDLTTGIEIADRLLEGQSTLVAKLSSAGLPTVDIEVFAFDTPRAEGSASGQVGQDQSRLRYNLVLEDMGVLAPALQGTATAVGQLSQDGDRLTLGTDVTGPGGLDGAVNGTLTLVDGAPGPVRASLDVQIPALAAYARLLGQPLRGALEVDADVDGDLAAQTGVFAGRVVTRDVRLNQSQADALLAGTTSVDLRVRATGPQTAVIDEARISGPQLSGTASGQVSPAQAALRYDLALANLGVLVPELAGRATAMGELSRGSGPWRIETSVTGPAGINANVNGTAAQSFDRVNLAASGRAPLTLVNQFTGANRLAGDAVFALRIDGAPGLDALSGRVRTENAQIALPGQPIGLENVAAEVSLGGGRADVNATADLRPAGGLRVQGPIFLEPPFRADLRADLRNVEIRQPGVFETEIDGQLTISGPLTGGARIGGDLSVQQAEIRVADATGSVAAGLPGLEHINEPRDVRETRERAGLVVDPAAERRAPRVVFPLDVRISAPNRIFARGRGLDAELGGAVRVQGTTANVVPSGEFSLIRGRFDLLGKRLQLTEGTAQLRGALDPFIRLIAETQAGDVLVRILVEGFASSPQVSVTSIPDLPQDEVLARLLFGRGLDKISPLQAVRLAAAVGTLLGRDGNDVVGRLRQTFRLDDLDVVTEDDGSIGVRAGAYLSENIYSDFTTTSSGRTKINLNIDVTPNVTVRGSTGSDGNTSLGVFFEKDY